MDAGAGRRSWKLSGPFHLGSVINDFRLDPRDGKTLLMTATGGHLGPTVFRSKNGGRTWKEARRPPKFGQGRKATRGKQKDTRGLSVKACFWLSPGHADEPGVWYVGTAPVGIFRSTDDGETWKGLKGFNESPDWGRWTFGGNNETPGGSLLHSIQIDPRDEKHMYASMSIGGTFESHDRGRSWNPLNKGVAMDFMPGPAGEFGHDPHCMVIHPGDPDVLYQQNHCGIYRLDRNGTHEWKRIGRKMPKKIGDIGFPIVPHPTNPDVVWVFPMDGTQVWPRTSPDGRPAVYRTEDGGRSWDRLDRGLPRQNAWYTVKRQAMCASDDARRTNVYFGTTSGEIWAGGDGGESWKRIAEGLPHVYSVRFARFR
ncbi:MAG: glycosyl hydrolase [Planctomycetota bacterium]|nr:glycosyl hydrolase [Planctomycetota bacterium]